MSRRYRVAMTEFGIEFCDVAAWSPTEPREVEFRHAVAATRQYREQLIPAVGGDRPDRP